MAPEYILISIGIVWVPIGFIIAYTIDKYKRKSHGK